ncbi:MAG: reverse transcriptase domain-containing protein [Rhodospirillales bacterium]|nr:reverse transcriptase domain-containing protein [Rhodospirillales bacterium]
MPRLVFGPPLAGVKIPPELASEAALITYLGVSVEELKKIWWFRKCMYRRFEVSKGKNKTRIITAPDERLKYLQRQIALSLNNLYRVRNPVHGFVPGRSVRTNALAHLRRRFVLNIDLKDFFPSITENRVTGLLESVGLGRCVASIIARLCCQDNCLPQGAPTSPVLSNMICFRLDKKLMAVARDARCIYTRYADDITFSGHQPPVALFDATVPSPGHFPPDLLALKLRDVFQHNGFVISSEKSHYADRNSRRVVTGLKINELLNVDRRYVRNIRAALFSIEKLGIAKAQAKFHDKHGGNCGLATHLRGKIAFLTHIKGRSDPVVRSITCRFNACFPEMALKVDPTSAEIRDRSVWVVDNDALITQGSAFFLKDVGLLTAAHCVKETTEVQVYHPSKRTNTFAARVLKMDLDRDIALLEHDIPNTEYFELARSDQTVAQGDHLIAIGYPNFGPGDGLNVREGKVSSLPVKHGVKLIEVTQKLSQGMSGGPLLDSDNAVVGVIQKGGPTEERDLAIHIEMLSAWLSE